MRSPGKIMKWGEFCSLLVSPLDIVLNSNICHWRARLTPADFNCFEIPPTVPPLPQQRSHTRAEQKSRETGKYQMETNFTAEQATTSSLERQVTVQKFQLQTFLRDFPQIDTMGSVFSSPALTVNK